MRYFTQLHRLLYIQWVLARYSIDKIVLSIPFFAPLRFLAYANPWNWRRKHQYSRGVRIRLALETLGPVFIKFGQALSTRRDLLPDDIADELAKLQDAVPPFSSKTARKIVEKTYDKPLALLFKQFELTPLASASIAQVHAAQLFDGQEVVVKIVRPHIKKIIRRDVNLLKTFAKLFELCWREAVRLRPQEIVAEFERHIFAELDLLREAANASQLRRNFFNSPLLYVPEIYWPYAHSRVMVMERISGVPISNIAQLRAKQVDLKKLAEQGVEIFFMQVFRDCFFHADMHPGNIFVATHNPNQIRYLAVDFGIMGTLNQRDQRYLAQNLLAFFHRDYRRVAELHVESGWVPKQTRLDEFESAIRTVCEPIFEKPLKDISCGQMLVRLFQIGRHFNMEVQPQLILLQKTLLNVEGLGRQLYPDLDLWSTAKPFLEKWLREQLGIKAFVRKFRNAAPYWAEKLPELPGLLFDTLEQLRDPGLKSYGRLEQAFTQKNQAPKHWYFILGTLFGMALSVSLMLLLALSSVH